VKAVLKQTTDLNQLHPQPTYNTNMYAKNNKRLQLVSFSLSGDEDWDPCPENVGECMATEPYP
jgi:hypothetical protein